jgi:Tol biopolymer transport system component/DNA-binding winged helix-turn-helix (wHTH) protein
MDDSSREKVRCYAFAPFVVDLDRRQLWRGVEPVPLTAKTFDVLAFLLANRHRPVTKEEFFTNVWPGTIVLEANLFRQMSLIRRALHQPRDGHDFIVTLPGRGYQFVADVTELNTVPAGLRHNSDHEDAVSPLGTVDRPSDATFLPPTSPAEPSLPTPSVGRSARLMTLRESATAVVVLGVALFLFRGEPSKSFTPTPRKFTFDSAFPREPSWSPDGRALAYTSDRSGSSDIWIQTLSDPTPTRVTAGGAKNWQPHWSPAGDQIVFRSETDGGGVFVVSASGGTPRRLTNFGYHPRWSPDGKLILFSNSSIRTGARRLFVTNATGETPREVAAEWTKKLRDASNFNVVHANWSPDAQHVSLWGRFTPGEWSFVNVRLADGVAHEMPVAADVRERIRSQSLTLGNFAWSPTGNYLYFEGRQQDTQSLWRVGVDPETKEWVSGPDRLSLGTTDDVHLALSPDGTRVAFTSQTTEARVWVQPFDSSTGALTGAAQPITPGNAKDRDVDVSDDGLHLAYRTQRGEHEEIWAYSLADSAERLLLSSTTARRTSPLWSPDGDELLYARRMPTGNAQVEHALAILPVSGGNERVLTLHNRMAIDPRDWSRDGKVIVGQCRNESMTGLGTCLVSLADRGQPSDVKMVAYDPALSLFCQRFSPNERWISFLAATPGNFGVSRIYLVSADGGRWIPVTDGTTYEDKPRWSPDGRTLYFLSSRSGSLNVWGQRIDPATGTPVGGVFPVTSYEGGRFGLSPELGQMEIAVTRDKLFLPMVERTGAIWLLEGLQP